MILSKKLSLKIVSTLSFVSIYASFNSVSLIQSPLGNLYQNPYKNALFIYHLSKKPKNNPL